MGPNWAQEVPPLQIMAHTNLLTSLAHSNGYALLAIGKIKLLAVITWLQVIIFLILAIVFFPQSRATEIATLRVLTVAIGSTFLIGIALVQINVFYINDYLKQILRPLVATGEWRYYWFSYTLN